MNKYYLLLGKVLAEGKTQQNKKGKIKYLLNEQLMLTPADPVSYTHLTLPTSDLV